jgi:hypothetical protein
LKRTENSVLRLRTEELGRVGGGLKRTENSVLRLRTEELGRVGGEELILKGRDL